MSSHTLETYLEAAQRENTQRSYASAIRHFEVSRGGLLPATADTVARYLAAMRPLIALGGVAAEFGMVMLLYLR